MNEHAEKSVTRNEYDSGACKAARGVTLIELMIAMAIGAILLTVAVPSFSTVLERNRVSSASEQLYVSIALARAEAVKRRSAVRVCPLAADQNSCRNDGDWNHGWMVWDGTNPIKIVGPASLAGNVNVLSLASALDNEIVFEPTGSAWGHAGRLRVCHTGSVWSRDIEVKSNGGVESTALQETGCGEG